MWKAVLDGGASLPSKVRGREAVFQEYFLRHHSPVFFEQVNRPATAIAPADFNGWADYQGDEQRVNQAIEELLDRVGESVKFSKLGHAKRKPR